MQINVTGRRTIIDAVKNGVEMIGCNTVYREGVVIKCKH